MKGSEERAMMFARLFGLIALADSGTLFASTATIKEFGAAVDSLIALGEAKEWLAESAGWGLVRVVEGLVASSVEWKAEALNKLTEIIYTDNSWTPEKVALTLLVSTHAPELDWKTFIAPTFKHAPLLDPRNLPTLGRVLKEGGVAADEDKTTARAGTYKPQLHFVWDVILNTYFKTEVPSTVAPFSDFFRVVVDDSLFGNTSSPERKYWGFQVFERALPLVDAASVPLVFTPNFMRSWINNLSSSDRHLHKAAVSAAKVVQEHVKTSPAAGFTLLSQLVGKHGRPDFDRVTKTKTVESIMASLTPEGVLEYVTYLESVVLGADTKDVSALEDRRAWALDQMVALMRNGAVPKTDEWVSRVLDFFLVHGFFIVRKADKKSKIKAVSCHLLECVLTLSSTP
jgi:DNA polymerase phi